MKSKISIVTFFVFIFVSSFSFAQYKYDIGLKASTYDMERFQLEGRFHLDNPYSLTATLVSGFRWNSSYNQTPFYNDSVFDITQSSFEIRNIGFKLGVQRKLGFLATDVFYAGATIGFGFEEHTSSYFTSTYSVSDSISSPNPYMYQWNELASSHLHSRTNAVNAQLGLSFGMDVPITKRFSINAELGFAGVYSKHLDYNYTIITFQGMVSGGLRYSFGKRS